MYYYYYYYDCDYCYYYYAYYYYIRQVLRITLLDVSKLSFFSNAYPYRLLYRTRVLTCADSIMSTLSTLLKVKYSSHTRSNPGCLFLFYFKVGHCSNCKYVFVLLINNCMPLSSGPYSVYVVCPVRPSSEGLLCPSGSKSYQGGAPETESGLITSPQTRPFV